MSNDFSERLASGETLLADGAVGTNLFAAGLQTGDAPELWTIDHPDRIDALHAAFVDAGSDLVLTNTFGGTHFRLALHNVGHRVAELNTQAARLARVATRRAPASRPPMLVAGSMGPTGEILQPNGAVSIDDARAAFRAQAEALAEGGVDMLWIETMSSAEEVEAAILAAGDIGLPIVCTVSIDTNGRTMMGLTAAQTIELTSRLRPDVIAVGTNCGVGASEVVAAIVNFRSAQGGLADSGPDARPAVLVAKANCGIPEWQNGRIVYDGTPALMADYAELARNAGARIIGGCCGTTAAHIASMRHALDTRPVGESPAAATIVSALGEISQGARAQLAGDQSVAGGSASGRAARGSNRRRRSN